MTAAALNEFCEFNQISGGYIGTSAKENQGIDGLLEKIKTLIPCDDMPATITTYTFKRVKRYVLSLKEQTSIASVIVSPTQLREQLEATDADWSFTDAEMMTAVKHLENHGYVTLCTRANGGQSVLLFPDILVNLVSSFVLAARGNPHGLGVLDEKQLLTGEYGFADLKDICDTEQEVLLDAAAVLFMNKNICFRESLGGASQRALLVFPSLINEQRPKTSEMVTQDDASYVVTGAVENVYASMVVLLGYTDHFTRKNQWQNQAQYELKADEVCGFRQLSAQPGEIELTLYYSDSTPPHGRMIFQGLFESFLQHRNVQITRLESVRCLGCGELQERASVMKLIDKGRDCIHCIDCGEKVNLPKSTELTPIAAEGQTLIADEKAVARRRTDYETALVRIKTILRQRENEKGTTAAPSCFISYSWGVSEHEKWVLQLVKDLRNADIEVVFDRWHNIPGHSIIKFIEKIEVVDFTLAVGTESYLKKYQTESEDPVVDAELRMIGTRLRKRAEVRETVLPLLLEGTQTSSFPPMFEDSVFINFTERERYFVELFRLLLRLHGIPFDYPGLDELMHSLEPDKWQ
ncbi:MAG: toll/interleukin-1 receptor domain-containing protein [Algicola sp.]|nr:toll/interleukin-1 receptor domain-containing protein [Algicola sp.]